MHVLSSFVSFALSVIEGAADLQFDTSKPWQPVKQEEGRRGIGTCLTYGHSEKWPKISHLIVRLIVRFGQIKCLITA